MARGGCGPAPDPLRTASSADDRAWARELLALYLRSVRSDLRADAVRASSGPALEGTVEGLRAADALMSPADILALLVRLEGLQIKLQTDPQASDDARRRTFGAWLAVWRLHERARVAWDALGLGPQVRPATSYMSDAVTSWHAFLARNDLAD